MGIMCRRNSEIPMRLISFSLGTSVPLKMLDSSDLRNLEWAKAIFKRTRVKKK